MPIRRKDGSIYKLQRPNPLMADQEIWSRESILMYNMPNLGRRIAAEVGPEAVRSEPENPGPVKNEPIMPEVALPTPEKAPEAPKPEPIPEPIPAPKPEPTIEQKKQTERDEVLLCLPAVIHEQRDPLYNEVVKRVGYRDPFRFLARVVQQNDAQFIIFTTDSRVVENSVVYHPDLRRWWKATEVAETKDGRFVKHFISDITPDFSGV